ncbi:phosphotransferase family protein [Streptomyces sp. NBC_01716]|uniref:phosphotransferase family protein n=1 Tax=Streptomyces sp. NBC_01716 TaxID=2975917 RepID=UPI002E32131C|nr:aminoglycoside phosphotransferase family protein [Streptomyces sp. NBC_01716]
MNRDGQPGAAPALIAARHGVAAENVRPMLSGVANRAYRLGPDLVLRVPRTEEFVADLVKEAAVIPVARAAGVRTPALVAFDDSRTVVDVPYMVLERAPGVDLASLGGGAGGVVSDASREVGGVFRDVGRDLARLHRVTPAGAGEPARVPVEYDPDAGAPHRLVEGLLADGMLDAEAARWLGGWFGRLAERIPDGVSHVLVHGDIAPQNLLVTPGPPGPLTLTGIVDWGDAMWADPAVEFAKTPLSGVPAMLDGYREGGAADGGEYAFEARVLRYHLTWALARLRNPAPVPGERHWTAPPAARLLGILRFFASSPPAPWAALV